MIIFFYVAIRIEIYFENTSSPFNNSPHLVDTPYYDGPIIS